MPGAPSSFLLLGNYEKLVLWASSSYWRFLESVEGPYCRESLEELAQLLHIYTYFNDITARHNRT